MPESAPVPVALVMSGGGARAAYQVGVLRTLVRHWPDWRPSIITGVSAGAINATALAGRSGTFAEAVGLLSRLWGGLTTDDVFRTDAARLSQLGMRWSRRLLSAGRAGRDAHGLLDTEPLRGLIGEVLAMGGEGRIERNIHEGRLDAFAVTATDYGTGRTVTWVQGRGVNSWDRPRRRSIRARIGVEHIMASAALPLIFPAIEIGGAWYGDGGIGQTAPLAPAVRLGAERILAVNTNHGGLLDDAELPIAPSYPPPAQILGSLMNAVFLDTMDQDEATLRRITALARRLPEADREGLKPIEAHVVRPSMNVSLLAAAHEVELPGTFRFFMRGLGTRETTTPDWLSMLLFSPPYLREVMALGEANAEAYIDDIALLLGQTVRDVRRRDFSAEPADQRTPGRRSGGRSRTGTEARKG